MNAKQHFDKDYEHRRKLMVCGAMSVEEVRSWLHQIGQRTENRIVKEREQQIEQKWGTNSNRKGDEEILRFGNMEKEDE